MPGSDANEFADLLPDYVAECDEHLTAARGVLLAVEPAPDRAAPGQLDQLFRDFHTIKGLSGMVGVRGAERLAHHLENYLGAVRKGRAALTAGGVAVLIDGVRTLDAVVAALRDRLPPPDVDAVITRAAALVPGHLDSPAPSDPAVPAEPPAAGLPPGKRDRLETALRLGGRAWRVVFAPSPAAADRGLTVDAVRARLSAAGEILLAEPTVVPGGGVTFTFVVVAPNDAFVPGLVADGLTVEPYAAAPPPEELPHTAAPLTPANLVRVDLGRIDDLMRTVADLVITRARLENGLGRVAGMVPATDFRELQETGRAMERQLRDLREGVMRVRLVPVRDVLARMRFVVRDLAREAGREVELVLSGEDTEIDKFVVERLADPLLHLVRNAVSHGIEPRDERIAAGKPPRGRVDLRAAAAGGAIRIEVEDDGRGIDPDRVFARARAAGLVPSDAPTDPAAVLDLLCTPGFSTRETADRASGRGVGMDVVRKAVEELGGELALLTRAGLGTRFTARLPLTLAIADAVIVVVGGETYAVPQAAVREVVQVEPAAAARLENNELIRHRGGVLPLLRLTDLFGTARPPGAFPALVVGDPGQAAALGVDRVLGLREVVVHPLADELVQARGLAGATELGDGRAVLILDVPGLLRHARSRRVPPA